MDARLNHQFMAGGAMHPGVIDASWLIRSHLALVRKLAWHVHSRMSSSIEVEDLIQIGTIALIEAARNFEDRGAASFATYATMRIRGAMIDALRKSATMLRSAMRRRREFGAARAVLEGQLGRAASDDEMATQLEMDVAAYRTAVSTTAAVRHESIDAIYSDHSEWFADASPSAFDTLARDGLRAAVAGAIDGPAAVLRRRTQPRRDRPDPWRRSCPRLPDQEGGARIRASLAGWTH